MYLQKVSNGTSSTPRARKVTIVLRVSERLKFAIRIRVVITGNCGVI